VHRLHAIARSRGITSSIVFATVVVANSTGRPSETHITTATPMGVVVPVVGIWKRIRVARDDYRSHG
jgi:hypothetical protein